tara:strand:+ start:139 stop:516 length:378 start_codon:yes stop_codon:yes gene_type:complete
MDFKLPLAVFSQTEEDHKKRYKENYDSSKNYPKYSGVMQITEEQIIKLCTYVQKAKPEHSDFHGEGVVTIRATGYLNESKQGKKYIGLNLEPDFKTMKAIEEADVSPEWKSSPKVPDKKEEEFPF